MNKSIEEIFRELQNSKIDQFQLLLQENVFKINMQSLNIVDRELLDELKTIVERGYPALFFGKSMRDIKCVLQDDCYREHDILINYKAPKKLSIVSVNLPYSPLQDKEFKTMEEIIVAFNKYINDLRPYFNELERIDRFCTVTEPVNPSIKDDYRKILLDDRTWLHIEVTPEGLATNIHLVGQSEIWQDKLQAGLLTWDHDKDIVENIMNVFDLTEFPVSTNKCSKNNTIDDSTPKEAPTCAICLCDQLPDHVGLPQPLCQNVTCGVYFHRSCLYQWLVACSGSRPPAFGVATGACPTCLQPISCSEKDS